MGYLPETGPVQNTNLESQMLGLTRKISKLKKENEWTEEDKLPLMPNFTDCDLGFNEVRDRSKFSENNHVSDIILRRFVPREPSIYQKLMAVRQTSIGMDTRQYTKDRWRKQNGSVATKTLDPVLKTYFTRLLLIEKRLFNHLFIVVNIIRKIVR